MENTFAFPLYTGFKDDQVGLTKREWFTGMALQGLLQGHPTYSNETGERIYSIESSFAIAAVKYADEVLKYLDK